MVGCPQIGGVMKVLFALLLMTSAAFTEPIVGRASVVDGDTIEIHGERIRFNGIDAPESNQLCRNAKDKNYRCGKVAADALAGFLAKSRPTKCEYVERDRYGRFVGDCYRADGQSVASWLVRQGHAMDWPRYSDGAYSAEQAAAELDRTGMWAGQFQPPWEWRTEQNSNVNTTAPAAASGACAIKGNISRKGERIYHVPGQKYYHKTSISEGKGERWFCSEDEARAAGWRRSRT